MAQKIDWESFIDEPENIPGYQSALGGVLQGATMGFADELAGAGRALMDPEAIRRQGLLESYKKQRDISRAKFAQEEQANPKSYLAGELGGSLATAPLTGPATLPKAMGLGAAYGLGKAEGSPLEQAGEAVTGAALGGVGEKVIGAASPYIKQGLEKGAASLSTLGEKAKSAAEPWAFSATGAMLKDWRKSNKYDQVHQIGRDLLDEGVVTGLASRSEISKRAAEKAKVFTDDIDNALTQIDELSGDQKAFEVQRLVDQINNIASGLSKKPSDYSKTQADFFRRKAVDIEAMYQPEKLEAINYNLKNLEAPTLSSKPGSIKTNKYDIDPNTMERVQKEIPDEQLKIGGLDYDEARAMQMGNKEYLENLKKAHEGNISSIKEYNRKNLEVPTLSDPMASNKPKFYDVNPYTMERIKKEIPQERMSLSELEGIKRDLAKDVKFDAMNPEAKRSAADQLRNLTQKDVEKEAEILTTQANKPELLKDFLTAKRKTGSMSEAYKVAEDRVQRDEANRFISASDYGAGLSSGLGATVRGSSPVASGLFAMGAAVVNKIFRTYGSQSTAVTLDAVGNMLKTAPEKLGKYGPVFEQALQKGGPRSLNVLVNVGMKKDPELAQAIASELGVDVSKADKENAIDWEEFVKE